ncbi:MAG: MBL fold metallo-hydrolase [Pseudomonadota bacterium]
MSRLTRRSVLGAAAVIPLAPNLLRAEAPMLGVSFAQHRRFLLGDFEVTTILAGTTPREDPQSIFGTNVSAEEFAAVSDANFLSTEVAQFYFTPTVVNTGAELVLFDTGLSGPGTTAVLAAAGYAPEQFDKVVLTHMHGDHIGGLMSDGAPTFANATYVTGQTEFDFWAGAGNDGFEANVRPLADRFSFVGDDAAVTGGVTSVASHGHTPGHMAYRVDSGDAALLIMGDLAAHPIWSIANPDWELRFDMDKAAASATRRRMLDMAAVDRIPSVFYHVPFPAIGYVDTDGDGYRWIPETGQLMAG